MFCVCQDRQDTDLDTWKCSNPNCSQVVHLPCHGLTGPIQSPFECPSCLLKFSDPFYQVVKTLQPAIHLISFPKAEFNITSTDYQLLTETNNQNTYVALRCIKLSNDPSSVHYDAWPLKGSLSFNNVRLNFKDLIDSQIRRSFFKRILLKEEVQSENNILSFDLDSTEKGNYYFGIFIVSQVSLEVLKVKVKEGQKLSIEESKRFIKDYFQQRETSKFVSVSVMDDQDGLIETPVRGRGCKHITCFSLESFLRNQIESSTKKWNCPICKNRAYHLIVDEYFVKIISKYQGKKLFKYSVTFYRSGTFEVATNLSKGDSVVNAIQVEDLPDPSSRVGEALSILKESIGKFMSPDSGFATLTVASSVTIQSEFKEVSQNRIIPLNKLHEIVMNIFDPLALNRHDGIIDREEKKSLEPDSKEKDIIVKIKAFLYAFLHITAEVCGKVGNLGKVLEELEVHASKYEARFSLEISFLYTLKFLMINFETVKVARKQVLEALQKKQQLTSLEKDVLDLYFDWKTFYNQKAEKVSYSQKIPCLDSKDYYMEFPLIFNKVGPQRFNWAFKHEICIRKGLWKIVWNPNERWFNVDENGTKEDTSKDPFSGMLANDIDMIMDEIMYLKECWMYERKLDRKMSGNGAEGHFVQVLKPYVAIEMIDFLKNGLVSEKTMKEIKSEDYLGSLKKGNEDIIEKFIKTYEINLM